MANVVHPILGALDLSSSGFWEATVAFGGREVTFDLTIDAAGLTAADIDGLPQQPEDLESFDRVARRAILHDAQSADEDSAAMLYITHHQCELPAPEFQTLFGTDGAGLADIGAMLSRLVLVRVGLYPESNNRRLLLDYSIDSDATNYLLCVSFDSSRQPVAVDLES